MALWRIQMFCFVQRRSRGERPKRGESEMRWGGWCSFQLKFS